MSKWDGKVLFVHGGPAVAEIKWRSDHIPDGWTREEVEPWDDVATFVGFEDGRGRNAVLSFEAKGWEAPMSLRDFATVIRSTPIESGKFAGRFKFKRQGTSFLVTME